MRRPYLGIPSPMPSQQQQQQRKIPYDCTPPMVQTTKYIINFHNPFSKSKTIHKRQGVAGRHVLVPPAYMMVMITTMESQQPFYEIHAASRL